MIAWAHYVNVRAAEVNSTGSDQRATMYDHAARPDPSLAEGMLAAQKRMARAVTEAERVSAAAAVGRSELYARERRIEAAEAASGKPKRAASRIQEVITAKLKAREEETLERCGELEAAQFFSAGGPIMIYTPREFHGSSEDMSLLHPVAPKRYPGLAASARDATHKNEVQRKEDAKQRSEWLAGKITRGGGGEKGACGGNEAPETELLSCTRGAV